jgi:quercetin dioxygenase-like cupin family protein
VHEIESSAGIPERGWVDMDVRWLVTKDNVGAAKTVFGVTYFPPGSKHDLHRHPNAEEVEYLISGSGIAYVDDDAVELGPGEAVFVPQNAYHGFENTSDDETVMAWCYAGAASLEEAGFVTRQEDEAARR